MDTNPIPELLVRSGCRLQPKHPAIREEFRRRILQGEFGARLPSLRGLAKVFQVNTRTISKVLDALTEEGLIRIVPRKGLYLVRRSIRTVSLVCYARSLGNDSFYGRLVSLLDRGLSKHQYRSQVFLRRYGPQEEDLPPLAELSSRSGDAVLAVAVEDEAYLLGLVERGIPLVAFDYVPADPRIAAVGVDGFGGGMQATEFLIKQGHRRILFLGFGRRRGTIPDVDSRLREAGYALAMDTAGLKPCTATATSNHRESGVQAFEDALARLPEWPTAVFAADDNLALSVRDVCLARGKSIPKDLSLVGFGGSPDLDISTIKVDWERLSELAIEHLEKVLDTQGAQVPQIKLSGKLIDRGTVRTIESGKS